MGTLESSNYSSLHKINHSQFLSPLLKLATISHCEYNIPFANSPSLLSFASMLKSPFCNTPKETFPYSCIFKSLLALPIVAWNHRCQVPCSPNHWDYVEHSTTKVY